VDVEFPCPLCWRAGIEVPLLAELDVYQPVPVVVDIQGWCRHAAHFGGLTAPLEEDWQIIVAAIDELEGTGGASVHEA
jgi:hypothetical protein